MKIVKVSLAIAMLLSAGVIFSARSLADGETEKGKYLVNTNKHGLALQGYDPVAYFEDEKAIKGKRKYTATHEEATYRFKSAAHRDLFIANPAKYAPAFGGYCAYGVAKNGLFKIDPNAWSIEGDRLLLQFSKSAKETFEKRKQANLERADANWPGLVEKHTVDYEN